MRGVNILKNNITDEELQKIIHEYIERDIDLDKIETFDEHTFSDRHNKRMNKLLKTNNKNISKFTFWTRINKKHKIAAALLLIFFVANIFIFNFTGISFGREIVSVIVKEFNKYSILVFDDNEITDGKMVTNSLVYKNEEFELKDTVNMDLYREYKYINSKGKYINIGMAKKSVVSETFIDTEGVELKHKNIDGIICYFYEKDNKSFLFFNKGDYSYNIESNLSIYELFGEIEKIN